MTNKDAIKILRDFNKYRRGKGRKYEQPGIPVDYESLGNAIDFTIDRLRYQVDTAELSALTSSAMIALPSFNWKSTDPKHYENTKSAIKSAKRVISAIVRRENKTEAKQ